MKESSFQFNKPVLKNVEYKICQEFNPEKEVNIYSHFHRNIIRVEDKNEAIVELTIKIGSDERSMNPPFMVGLTMMAGFRWDEKLDEENINQLLALNAPSLLLGYARPIIANITSNSVGQFDLPFMNFND